MTTEAEPDTGTEGTEASTEPEATEQPESTEPDWKAEAEKWQGLARKHEGRAKQNSTAAKELEALKASQLTDQEKAVAAARDEGTAEGRRVGSTALVRASVIAAAAGKAADPDDVYALLVSRGDLSDIEVGEDWSVDQAAVRAAVDKLLAEKKHLAAGSQPRDPDFGARTPTSPAQSADAQMDAFIRGRLGR